MEVAIVTIETEIYKLKHSLPAFVTNYHFLIDIVCIKELLQY